MIIIKYVCYYSSSLLDSQIFLYLLIPVATGVTTTLKANPIFYKHTKLAIHTKGIRFGVSKVSIGGIAGFCFLNVKDYSITY